MSGSGATLASGTVTGQKDPPESLEQFPVHSLLPHPLPCKHLTRRKCSGTQSHGDPSEQRGRRCVNRGLCLRGARRTAL